MKHARKPDGADRIVVAFGVALVPLVVVLSFLAVPSPGAVPRVAPIWQPTLALRPVRQTVVSSPAPKDEGHRTGGCAPNRQRLAVPGPLASYEVTVRFGCSLSTLPVPERAVAECIAWAESRDHVHEAPAGLFQFTDRQTWDEFARGWARRWPVPSQAPLSVQARVLVRAWRVEQWKPWDTDPCVGTVAEDGRYGWQP